MSSLNELLSLSFFLSNQQKRTGTASKPLNLISVKLILNVHFSLEKKHCERDDIIFFNFVNYVYLQEERKINNKN